MQAWKLPFYRELNLTNLTQNLTGYLWSDQLGQVRRVYNGRRFQRQTIRPLFVWWSSSNFVQTNGRRLIRQQLKRLKKKNKKLVRVENKKKLKQTKK